MSFWRRLFGRSRLERELAAELRDHVERQVADEVKAGKSEAEARRRAVLALGGVEQVKEQCRDARGTRWLDDAARDVHHGWRVLRKSPAFTAVAALSLALGIGANTAIFTLVNSLLLRSLPVREPERLALLLKGSWTNPIWEQIRERQAGLFDGAAAWSDTRFDAAPSGAADPINGIWVSGGFFDVLGVPAILGRTLTPADDRRGGGPEGSTAVLSYSFWQRRFGGAADVIGRSILLDRVPFTVVGVSGPGFTGPSVGQSFDVAAPLGMVDRVERGQESQLDGRQTWWLSIIARLKRGQSAAQATEALRAVQPQIREATVPDKWRKEDLQRYLKNGFTLAPAAQGASFLRDEYQRPLLTLMVVVGLVLLIACANIANLLLARADARRHELMVRLTIGASRFRVARQLLTESLLLASLGALLGLAFAQWGSQLLLRQLSREGDPVFLDLGLDWRVLAFTAFVAIGTALVFGVAPAFRASRVEPESVFKEHGRSLAGKRRPAFGHPLVVAQVALSLVVVVGATLFTRTFAALTQRQLGFDRDPVLIVGIDPKRAMRSGEKLALLDRALEAVSGVPGVARAAGSCLTPVSRMAWDDVYEFPDPDAPPLPEQERETWVNAVTPGWFATYGTSFLAGRDFGAGDRAGGPRVAIVNQTFARKYAKGVAALGRTVREIARPGREPHSFTIVGIVQDSVYQSPREEMPATLYLSMAQMEDDLPPFSSLSVRAAAGAPALLAKGVADAITRVDPNVSLTFRSLAEQVEAKLMRERLLAMLSGFFGVLALGVAGVGLYGVTSYGVSRRRAEIGLRMALGADAAGVVRLVLGRMAMLVALGLAVGTLLGLWASRFVDALLYGMPPRDPTTFVGAAALLALVGLLSAALPARRAARMDPAEVLREG